MNSELFEAKIVFSLLPKTLKRDNDGMIEAAIRQHFAALCRD
jgi:hypothetical protein